MIEPICVELQNHNLLGDVTCMTCVPRDMAAVRRCTSCGLEIIWKGKGHERVMKCPKCGKESLCKKYKVRIRTSFPHLWDNNPYLDDFESADMVLKIGPGYGCQHSNHIGMHMTEAYRLSILEKSGGGITFPQGELIPDLHLSKYEEERPPLVEGRYWLICTSASPKYSSKVWPYDRWQEVVDKLPHITFVQIGHSSDFHPRLKGDNVIDFIGRTEDSDTGIRDLLNLFWWCDGSAGLVSMHAHIAAAFKKPAVVVAGAREPVRFEQYAFHQYLHNQGAMRCIGKSADGGTRSSASIYSCWRASIDACPNKEGDFAKCLSLISVDDVVDAIEIYYKGGILESVEERASVRSGKNPVFKMICNAHSYGGGERSAVWLMNAMLKQGYDVKCVPSRGMNVEFKDALSPYVEITKKLTEPCDVFMMYSNDMVYKLQDDFRIVANVQADKKIMVLNYRLGDVGKVDWTAGWDKYIFLCSDLRDGLLKRMPGCDTVVLPPPVDLSTFLEIDLGSLNKTPHFVRVSSQGDTKYPQEIEQYVRAIRDDNPNVRFSFMPPPSFLSKMDRVSHIPYNDMPVPDVLRKGTVFWYMLPPNYLDNGPRVIMEAMAVGLPVIADNRGGAKDRVTEETGWLCNSPEEHLEIISNLNGKELTYKGNAAKERARTEFDPERWIEEIIGE